MEHKRSVWTRLYHSFGGRALIAALIAAAALAAFSAVQQISYLTNDDNAIAYTLAGYHTGTPAPYALFINCLLGFVISALYTASPNVPWWAVAQLVGVACSIVVIGACFLCVGARRGAPLLTSLALFGALVLLCFLQPVVELTYTVTAAILGAAGVALVYCAAGEEHAKKRTVWNVLGALLVFGAFLYREETGYAVLCFFLAACVYQAAALSGVGRGAANEAASGAVPGAAGAKKPAAKRAFAYCGTLFVVTLAACMGALFINNALQTRYHGQEYRTFFAYRERFTDYPRDTFAQNPALYESVGWDETLYDLCDDWCFMDARINATTLRAVTEGSRTQTTSLRAAVETVLDVLDSDVTLRLTCDFMLLAWAAALYVFLRNRRVFLPIAAMSTLLVGMGVLCLVLGLRGRFLARTFQVVAIPTAVSMMLLALTLLPMGKARRDRAAGYIYVGLAVATALATGLLQAKQQRVNGPKLLLQDSRAVIAYALEHPGNVYVRDTFVVSDVDAVTTYPNQKPTNLLSWGGCEMRSQTARRQLLINGLTSGYADVFLQDGVYFITRTGSSEQTAMERYLAEVYGARLELVETILGDIAVYRAVPAAETEAGTADA